MAAKSSKKRKGISGRYILIACVFIAWMGVLIWRLSYLQIARHEELTEKAHIQQGIVEPVKAFRGDIVDRRGRLLAGSIDANSIMADLHQVRDEAKTTIIKTLAPLLKISEEDLQRKFNSTNQAPIIAKKLDVEASNNLRSVIEKNKFTGIKILRETQRQYPNGELASHVIGYVDAAEQGVAGLEMRLNKQLQGQNGKLVFEKDALGNAFSRIDKEALAGARIVTTIDATFQHKVEQLLTQALDETKADSVSAIVIEPQTGEILAMANAPTFDPVSKFNGSETDFYVRRNRALTDVYEPGSVFKMVTYSAAIEEGLAKPDEKIHCGNGHIQLGSRIIHDAHPYGELTVSQALAKSSNVAAIKIASRVGNEKFADYMFRFGFGRKTGIDLPAEAIGLVNPLSRWGSTSLASMAMGHEVGVTALQAVTAMASIANRGVWVQPHVVKKIVTGDPGQRLLWEAKPETRNVISERTANTIKGMLEDVVETGTARHAVQLAGYTAAGKTGTAQKVVNGTYSNSAYIASFDGFVPVSNPRFAIIVVLDNPKGAHQGGQVAAPIFNKIAQAALTDYGVLPDAEDYRQAMIRLQEKFATTPKDWNKEPTASPSPSKVSATPTQSLKPGENAIAEPKLTASAPKLKPTPKPTPILKLPTPKETNKQAAQPAKAKVAEKPKPQITKTPPLRQNAGESPNVVGKNLREVASLCSRAGLKLKAIGSGTARNQRRVGDTLIVEFR